MKCLSCESEINPQWSHAIDQNICPFCGESIMDEHLKNLFSTLRETMGQLQNYQDQLNDWMISNHSYIKTDSPNLISYLPKEVLKELKKNQDDRDFQERKKFTVKVSTENGVQEIQAEKIQSEERTNEFFKRAEVTKTNNSEVPQPPGATPSFNSVAEKTAYHKAMVKQIKKAGGQGVTADGDNMILSPEMLENADPEAVAEYEAMVSGNEISSSLADINTDDDVPSYVLAANQAIAAKKGNSVNNAADLLKLRQMHEKMNSSRTNFNNGGGGFSRG